MNKIFKTIVIIFPFIFLFQSIVLGKQDNYNQCLELADIGNHLEKLNFDGIKIEDIDAEKSKKICLEAVDKYPDDPKILRSLGRIFLKEQNSKLAIDYFKKASNFDDGLSYYHLAEAYKTGWGVKKDETKAFQYIVKSKEKNHPYSFDTIGYYYEYGIGTKIDNQKALTSYKNCADLNINDCLYTLYVTYSEGGLGQKPNEKLKLFYINQMLKNESKDGYLAMGEHLINNAENEVDVRNALLNYQNAKEEAYPFLVEIYFLSDRYPKFSELYPNKSDNKKKGLKYLKKMYNSDEYENYGDNLFFLKHIINSPEYTKILGHNDLKEMIDKLDRVSKKFKPNILQEQGNYIPNNAASLLGDYYNNGYFTDINLDKSIYYYSLAADRQDYDASISAGWAAYKNKEYDKALLYNNTVIDNSKNKELILYAHNNNAVVNDELQGTGTHFQINSYLKAAKIVEEYGYFVTWPYENLANIYYYPINNYKNENLNIQDIKKSKFYHQKYLDIMRQNGYENVEEGSLFSFLFSKFDDVPINFDKAVDHLEYAAVNGYTYAYFELAWLYSGYKDKDYKKEVYKWYYICSVLAKTETQENCKANIEEYKNKISYFDRKDIEQIAADYILQTGDRLLALDRKLGFDKPKVAFAKNLNYGDYHAILIGVNKYKHFPDLRTPVNDINRLGKILKTKYKFDIKKLINPSRRDLLKEINKYTKSLSENDNLIIYFAGHGMQKSDEGFWLTKEAEKDDDIDWISNNTIVRKLREIKANNILVVADSCFSGLLTRGLNIQNKNINKSPLEVLHKSKSRIAITSGGNEPVLDGGGGENSIFAASLASELENKNSAFTASELFLNIQKKVIKETLAFGMKQSPIILDIPKSGHENFDFVFNPN